ncbi:MAG: hypothetical protein RR399_10155 [Lachnospiraceae bacterium]
MKKIVTLSIVLVGLVVILLMILISSCAGKAYNFLGETEENGKMIEIEGVMYQTLPNMEWEPFDGYYNGDVTQIGHIANLTPYSPYEKYRLYFYDDDADEHLFLMQRMKGIGTTELVYHRADYDFPEFDESGIDMIGFSKLNEYEGDGIFSVYTEKKEVIAELINIMQFEKTTEDNLESYWMAYIGILNKKLWENGAGVRVSVSANKNTYLLEYNAHNGERICKEISQKLVEEIAGERLPTPQEYVKMREEEQE